MTATPWGRHQQAGLRALLDAGVPATATVTYHDTSVVAVTWDGQVAAARRCGPRTWAVDGPVPADQVGADMVDAADGVAAYRHADMMCGRCLRPVGYYTARVVDHDTGRTAHAACRADR